MKLIIARHGEAENRSQTGLDKDRSLTNKGKADIIKMANFLRNTNIKITKIFHSSYLRTTETASIYADRFDNNIELNPEFALTPEGNFTEIIPVLQKFNNSDGILLVSHNPGVAYFASRLIHAETLAPSLPFSPGTALALNIPKERFTKGQLVWMLSPDDISC
ncbi:MAG: phosphohistidine phosphatase SixA [Leptospiraceae bacterium]|nr:phosphohistidine phosphatase SixA [Leptospiraceae bacterium]